MVRLMLRLAQWLDARFPEKLVVTKADYEALFAQIGRLEVELSMLTDRVGTLEASHAATVDRVAHVEASSTHKDAVRDLIAHVKATKAEMTALKANLGWSNRGESIAEISAVLNGEPISNE